MERRGKEGQRPPSRPHPPDRLYNYEGSWLEWSYHESNPVVSGQ